MEPYDVKCRPAVFDGVRNRTIIRALLLAGMRIVAPPDTRLGDVHLEDKRILIFEGEKIRRG